MRRPARQRLPRVLPVPGRNMTSDFLSVEGTPADASQLLVAKANDLAQLLAAGGSLTKRQIAPKVFPFFQGADNQNELLACLNSDDWLGGRDEFTYDGTTLSVD